jgi:hypothetical protein
MGPKYCTVTVLATLTDNPGTPGVGGCPGRSQCRYEVGVIVVDVKKRLQAMVIVALLSLQPTTGRLSDVSKSGSYIQ